MGMDRLLDRLRNRSGPPLRVAELAEAVGCSRSYIYKCIKAETIKVGKVGSDYRIPLQEAVRMVREAGLLLD